MPISELYRFLSPFLSLFRIVVLSYSQCCGSRPFWCRSGSGFGSGSSYFRHCTSKNPHLLSLFQNSGVELLPMLRIHGILAWIRIRIRIRILLFASLYFKKLMFLKVKASLRLHAPSQSSTGSSPPSCPCYSQCCGSMTCWRRPGSGFGSVSCYLRHCTSKN